MKKVLLLFLFISGAVAAQIPTPAPPQSESILILGAAAHTGTGEVIENSAIGFTNGKFNFVGKASDVNRSDYSRVIDAEGKHVYPGFIGPNSTLGLREIDAVRATLDFSETGALNPNVRTLIAFNTDSRITPTVRTNGVLTVQAAPRSGLVSGTSSIMKLDGWNWEDAVLKADDGIHINWPNMFTISGWWAQQGGVNKNKNYEEQVQTLYKFFTDAQVYAVNDKHEEKDLRFEAMRNLFTGKERLYIHADFVKEISEAVNMAKSTGVMKPVIVGGRDAWMVTDILKENNVPVIVHRLHELPEFADEDVDRPYKLPKLLQDAGVLFCLDYSGQMEAMNLRNLPFAAGTAAAYGLTKEEALASITLNAAKILGIDDITGSLETGKDATLFISTGDALDMITNNVETAFIQGREIELINEQIEQFKRYSEKYGIN